MKKVLFVALLSAIVFYGCKKGRYDFNKLASTEWKPSIAAPAINSTLTVYDVLAHTDSNDIVIIDSLSGLVSLVYKGNLYSYDPSNILVLSNQNANTSITLTGAQQSTLSGSGTVTVTSTQTINYNAGSANLDSIILKAGTLGFTINSSFQHNGSVTISIPALKKNGVPYSQTFSFTYSGTPVTLSANTNMQDYHLDLTQGGNTTNTFDINYSLTLNYISGNSTAGSFDITTGMNNWDFYSVFGDFGNVQIASDIDSILVKIFNSAITGTFELTDPKLNLYVHNSLGVPAEVTFNTLQSVNINTGQITPIINQGFANPWQINAPTVAQIGSEVVTKMTIDKNNSNITTIITPTPKYVIVQSDAAANPSSMPAQYNFMTDTGKMHIRAELELPLIGWAYGMTFVDTLPFEFGDNIKEIESVLFRSIITNGFPFKTNIQIYFADSNYVLLDSLYAPNTEIIQSGITNNDGRVIQKTEKLTDVTFTQNRMPNVLNSKYVIIRAVGESLNGTNNQISKIYEDYTIQVRLSLKVNGKYKL